MVDKKVKAVTLVMV